MTSYYTKPHVQDGSITCLLCYEKSLGDVLCSCESCGGRNNGFKEQRETKAYNCTSRQPKCDKALYLYDHCLHVEAILLWQMVDFYIWNSFRCQSAINSLIKRNEHFRDDASICLCVWLHPRHHERVTASSSQVKHHLWRGKQARFSQGIYCCQSTAAVCHTCTLKIHQSWFEILSTDVKENCFPTTSRQLHDVSKHFSFTLASAPVMCLVLQCTQPSLQRTGSVQAKCKV